MRELERKMNPQVTYSPYSINMLSEANEVLEHKVLEVTEQEAMKFRGNLSNLLVSKGISIEHLEFILYANNIYTDLEYDGILKTINYYDPEELSSFIERLSVRLRDE